MGWKAIRSAEVAIGTLEHKGFIQKAPHTDRGYALTKHGKKSITPEYYIFDEAGNPLQICRD